MLQRLAELGMQLAELAAREALEDSVAQTEHQATEPPRPRRADPRLIFLRLSRTIRETIVLKTRIAAGTIPPAPRPATKAAPPPDDPRRPLMIRYFREAIDLSHQKRKNPITHQHVEDRITTELAKDPQRSLPGQAILRSICKSLDLPFYANRVHIDLLRPPGATATGQE